MKKKIFIIVILMTLFITGCEKKEEKNLDAVKFKEEYETLNNDYLNVSVSDNNPFVYKNSDDIKNMMDNKETFLVFIGKSDDNYSRSLVETLNNSAYDNDLEVIYYINSNYDNLKDVLDSEVNIPIIFNVLNGKVETILTNFSSYNGKDDLTDEMKKENYDLINPIIKDTIDTINTCNTEC